MRSTPGALLTALSLVLLAGCTSTSGTVTTYAQTGFFNPSASPPPPLPVVTGGFGQQPRIAPGVGPAPTAAQESFLSEGKGDRVTSGVAPLVRYVETDWISGKVLHDDWASGAELAPLPVNDSNIMLSSMLNGIPLGSRLQLINPTSAGDATVYVVDVVQQGR